MLISPQTAKKEGGVHLSSHDGCQSGCYRRFGLLSPGVPRAGSQGNPLFCTLPTANRAFQGLCVFEWRLLLPKRLWRDARPSRRPPHAPHPLGWGAPRAVSQWSPCAAQNVQKGDPSEARMVRHFPCGPWSPMSQPHARMLGGSNTPPPPGPSDIPFHVGSYALGTHPCSPSHNGVPLSEECIACWRVWLVFCSCFLGGGGGGGGGHSMSQRRSSDTNVLRCPAWRHWAPPKVCSLSTNAPLAPPQNGFQFRKGLQATARNSLAIIQRWSSPLGITPGNSTVQCQRCGAGGATPRQYHSMS